MFLRALGWLLIILGALAATDASRLDRKLQSFRRPGVSKLHYWVVPWRLQEDLYANGAEGLVGRAWRRIGQMYGLTLLGALLLVFAG
jgi:hypothetical protein